MNEKTKMHSDKPDPFFQKTQTTVLNPLLFEEAQCVYSEKVPHGVSLFFIPHVDSTNMYLERHWQVLPPLSVLYCDTQSAGKGRYDRPWLSDCANNIYVSLLFKPVDPPFPCVNMTQYLSVALCKTLQEWGITATIKWPNDVLINGKKVAGILSRLIVENSKPQALIVGMGVNIHAPTSFLKQVQKLGKDATSVHLHTQRAVDRDVFLESFLQHCMCDYAMFSTQGFASIRRQYLTLTDMCNKHATINRCGVCLTGTVKTVTFDGELVLEDDLGIQHIFTMGDMT